MLKLHFYVYSSNSIFSLRTYVHHYGDMFFVNVILTNKHRSYMFSHSYSNRLPKRNASLQKICMCI